MKWLAKTVLGIGFVNHLFGGDEYDKNLTRRLALHSDNVVLSDYDLQALHHFVQKSESSSQDGIQDQTYKEDSRLVKDLIISFGLSKTDAQVLRRFVQWVQNSIHDQDMEDLYIAVLKWQEQQRQKKLGLSMTVYDRRLDQYVPEELIKLDLPVQRAIIAWFESWEQEQHLKQRLDALSGNRLTNDLEPVPILKSSNVSFEVDYAKKIEDLERRLLAIKSKKVADLDVIMPVAVSPNEVTGDIYESSYIGDMGVDYESVSTGSLSEDNLVVIEESLHSMGWNYKDLIKIDLAAKKSNLLIGVSESTAYDSDEIGGQGLEDAFTDSAIASTISRDLDENNLVVVELVLFKFAGNSYQELAQNMNFEQKKQFFRNYQSSVSLVQVDLVGQLALKYNLDLNEVKQLQLTLKSDIKLPELVEIYKVNPVSATNLQKAKAEAMLRQNKIGILKSTANGWKKVLNL